MAHKITATLIKVSPSKRGQMAFLSLSRPVSFKDIGSDTREYVSHAVVSETASYDPETKEPVIVETAVFPAYPDGRMASGKMLRQFPDLLDWKAAVRKSGWTLVDSGTGGKRRKAPLMPPHGRRRSPRKRPMKPQSVKRRWREYDAHVRESAKMAAAASRPLTGETAKLYLDLQRALKR